MKSLMCVIAVCLVGAGIADASQGRGRAARDRDEPVVRASNTAVSVSIVFSPREVTLIRTHYSPRYRSLPPGLRKKLARTGQLPPGWEKKMEPFPAALERDMIVLPPGYRRGVMDGHAVIYHAVTHAILDIASLF
jgi:hypothetical protein